jgi:hypothetical protein
VRFTGPSGSGLSSTPANPANSFLGDGQAFYQSPNVTTPSGPPGGAWSVLYRGTARTFSVPDPQSLARLVIPLPTVTFSGDRLVSVRWDYRDRPSGLSFGGPPAMMSRIRLQLQSGSGGPVLRMYDSPHLAPETTSHTLTQNVASSRPWRRCSSRTTTTRATTGWCRTTRARRR